MSSLRFLMVGVLEEEIYMEQPPGFVIAGSESKVCRLKKSIYRLKQAPHTWNPTFHEALTEEGLIKWLYSLLALK
jgi:hypothetical protein